MSHQLKRQVVNGLLIVALLWLLMPVEPARAASIVVNDLGGGSTPGQCSLRDAITAANTNTAINACSTGASGPDTITFSVTGVITLTGSLGSVSEALTIIGPSGGITITGNNTNFGSSLLTVIASTTVNLSNLTMTNALKTGSAGAAITNFGTLVLDNVTLSNNTSTYASAGISNAGTLLISNSTFSGNTCTNCTSGAIGSSGPITITNSTFANNSANGGGAIFQNANTAGISLTITNSTFSNNQAVNGNGGSLNVYYGSLVAANSTFSGNTASVDGGGIYYNSPADPGTITNVTFSGNSAGSGGAINKRLGAADVNLRNTIVTASPSGGNCNTALTDGGNNLEYGNGVTSTTCGFATASADPQLGALANNGGPTQTMKLLTGSPAIDQGNDAVCAAAPVNNKDQRGVMRPIGVHCDIGAVEAPILFLPLILR